jgi:hypothetical protein
MITGSFDRLATGTAHDHEVTPTRCSRGRLGRFIAETLDVLALPEHFYYQ